MQVGSAIPLRERADMSQSTFTFVSRVTGDVCLLSLKGYRGRVAIMDATWDRAPCKKDVQVKGMV